MTYAVDALCRSRSAWAVALTPILGRSDAVALLELVEILVPTRRRLRHAEHLAFLASCGDVEGRHRAIIAKARRTCTLVLRWKDGDFEDTLDGALPAIPWERLCRIAVRLRDCAETPRRRVGFRQHREPCR